MKRPPVPFYISRYLVKGIWRGLIDLTVEGKENITVNQQYILISNHLNWSDPFFLFTIFPPAPRIVFVAESEGLYNNIFKKLFVNINGKPIVAMEREKIRSRISALKSMYKIVKEGNILAIFPEGRLGHAEGKLFPFYIGIFTVAKKLGIPILPVAIAGTKELSLKKPVHIKIGKLTYCQEEETEIDYARRMAITVKRLIPDYPGDGPFPDIFNWMTDLCQGEILPFEGERTLIIPPKERKRDKYKK